MDLLLYRVVDIFRNLYSILLGFFKGECIVKYFLDNKLRIFWRFEVLYSSIQLP